MGIVDKGNGSFVLDLDSGISEESRNEKTVSNDGNVQQKDGRKSARTKRPKSGVGPDPDRVCIWFDTRSANAFRAAKTIFEGNRGRRFSTGEFLLALLDGEWESLPSSAKKVYKEFVELTGRK